MFRITTAVILLSLFCTSAQSMSKAANYLLNEQIGAACNGRPGTIDPSAFIERDLTGDGRNDLIIAHTGIRCTGSPSRSLECGVRLCSVKIYVREGPLLRLKDHYLGGEVQVGGGRIPVITGFSPGSGSANFQWNGRNFAALDTPQNVSNSGAPASGGFGWTSEAGQGIHNARVSDGSSSEISVICDIGSGRGNAIDIMIGGVRPGPDDQVRFVFDNQTPVNIWFDKPGRISTENSAALGNYTFLLQRLRRHGRVTVSVRGGPSSTFSLFGSSGAIGDCPLKFAEIRNSTQPQGSAQGTSRRLMLPGAKKPADGDAGSSAGSGPALTLPGASSQPASQPTAYRDLAALFAEYGLPTANGLPLLASSSANYKVYRKEIRNSLSTVFNLVVLGANPDVDPKSQTALCLANTFLSDRQKDLLLKTDGTVSSARQRMRPWKGVGVNEFETERAQDTFAANHLPGILARATRFPLEFAYTDRVTLSAYDRERGGFVVSSVPGSLSHDRFLPEASCFGRQRQLYLPLSEALPDLWQLDPASAEQVILRLERDQHENGRAVYAGLRFLLMPDPAPKAAAESGQRSGPLRRFKLKVQSYRLYTDPFLQNEIHRFEFEPAKEPALLAGNQDPSGFPEIDWFDQEAAALYALKHNDDVLGREVWESLLQRQLKRDEEYYKWVKSSDRSRFAQWNFHEAYRPFFPNGFGGPRGLTDDQRSSFVNWTKARATALPDQVRLRADISRNGGFRLDDSGSNDRPSPALEVLSSRGYVRDQIRQVDFELGRTGGYRSAKYVAGNNRNRFPFFVLPNLIDRYHPRFSDTEMQVAFGTRSSNYPVAFHVTIDGVQIIPIDHQNETLAFFITPTKATLVAQNRSESGLSRDFDVAALDPEEATNAPDVSENKFRSLPWNAETADLLLVRHVPESLDDATIERMLLARWHYETSFNNSEADPDWGRFFVKGKQKPDRPARLGLLEKFKEWTVARAEALPETFTLRMRHYGLNEPGPVKFGTPSYDYQSVHFVISSCRNSVTFLARQEPLAPHKSESYKNACDFLEHATTIPDPAIYLGKTDFLNVEKRNQTRKVLAFQDVIPEGSVGPRSLCRRGRLQDAYCTGLHEELAAETFTGATISLDDVLLLDKEVTITTDAARLADDRQVEVVLEFDVAGVRRSETIPPNPMLSASQDYLSFLVQAGLTNERDARLTKVPDYVAVNVFEARLKAAKTVDRDTGETVATLTLGPVRQPDTSMLQTIEPKQVPPPDAPYGLDVVGLRLGMTFDEADRIIREHMEVGTFLTADRGWSERAASGDIAPYTSGRLYESADEREIIILHDEPPAAPGVVLGIVRQVAFPKRSVRPTQVFASLRKKYGATKPGDDLLSWGETDSRCVPSRDESQQQSIWRESDGRLSEWSRDTLLFAGSGNRTPRPGSSIGRQDLMHCGAGLSVRFDVNNKPDWDRLVLRVYDQGSYVRQFEQSKQIIEDGGDVSSDVPALDLKL